MARSRQVSLSAIVLLLLALVLAGGCGQDSAGVAAVDEQGDLRIPLNADPAELDPQRTSVAANLGVVRQLFRGLLWYDAKLNLVPMAAKEVPTSKNGGISKDGLLLTFKLKEGLKWSDGQPLTASDFEYAAKRLFDPRVRAVRAANYYDIKGGEKYNTCKDCSEPELARLRDEVGVKATDALTLVVALNSPRSSLLNQVAEPAFYALRKDLIEKHGDQQWTAPENFVGSGPFVLKSRVPQVSTTLEPNSHWWGTHSRVRTLTFKPFRDGLSAFNAYLAGDLDIVEVPPDQKATVEKDPTLAKQYSRVPLLQTLAFFLNNRTPPFDNPEVRKAISLAVDREAFVSSVLQGSGQATYSWLPPQAPGYDDGLGLKWKFNREKARSTLAAAGFPDGAGLQPITFGVQAGGVAERLGEFLRIQLLEAIGVQIDLQVMPSACPQNADPAAPKCTSWGAALQNRQHKALGTTWTFNPDAGANLGETFGCQRYTGDECDQFPGNNLSLYSNSEVDRTMQQATKESNLNRRAALYAKAEKVISDDVSAVFVANPSRNLLVKPHVKGLVTIAIDSQFAGQYHLERAYIAAK